MRDRLGSRLDHILDAINQIDALIQAREFVDVNQDRVAWAAYERFLEIVSEASRHIPPELKASAPEIPWRKIADIGNHLRHAYDGLDPAVLWEIHALGTNVTS